MKSQILEILEANYKKTAGHNGLRYADLCEQLGVPFREIRADLNSLFLEGLIEIKNSINFKFIRLKDEANIKTNTEV